MEGGGSRAAVADTGVLSQDARFAVRMVFRLAASRTPNEVWDLDNLIKPTLDAMEHLRALRAWNGRPQAADDRVDRLEAVKRRPRDGEASGATIEVWIIDRD